MRLIMNPGRSIQVTTVFPRVFASYFVVSSVASDVWCPLITSMSSMRGTGFIKWHPMNISGFGVKLAKRVMEIDDVLDAIIQFEDTILLILSKRTYLILSFSIMASTTYSAGLIASKSVVSVILFRISLSSLIYSFLRSWFACRRKNSLLARSNT